MEISAKPLTAKEIAQEARSFNLDLIALPGRERNERNLANLTLMESLDEPYLYDNGLGLPDGATEVRADGKTSFLQNAFPDMIARLPDTVFSEDDFMKELPINAREIFDHIRDIKDPEHPMTLEELCVVSLDMIMVDDRGNCFVDFRPTVPHCSLATLIGLCIKVQLMRLLPSHFKINVKIVPGTHSQYDAINKQLDDKERVAAALENSYLLQVLDDCLVLLEPQALPAFIEEKLRRLDKLDHPKVKYIQYSRQHIESYRRWKYLLDSIEEN